MKMRVAMAVAGVAAVVVVAGVAFRPEPSAPGRPVQDSGATAKLGRTPQLSQPARVPEDGNASGGLTPANDSSALANDEGEPESHAAPSASIADGQDVQISDFFADALGTRDDGSDMSSPRQLQARMSKEPRDEAWAPHSERELQDYLARQPYISFYESVAVECRRTLCRIHATGNQAVLAAMPGVRDAVAHWQNMTFDLRHDSAWQNFSDHSVLVASNAKHPGRVGFVTFLKRADTSKASSK